MCKHRIACEDIIDTKYGSLQGAIPPAVITWEHSHMASSGWVPVTKRTRKIRRYVRPSVVVNLTAAG